MRFDVEKSIVFTIMLQELNVLRLELCRKIYGLCFFEESVDQHNQLEILKNVF